MFHNFVDDLLVFMRFSCTKFLTTFLLWFRMWPRAWLAVWVAGGCCWPRLFWNSLLTFWTFWRDLLYDDTPVAPVFGAPRLIWLMLLLIFSPLLFSMLVLVFLCVFKYTLKFWLYFEPFWVYSSSFSSFTRFSAGAFLTPRLLSLLSPLVFDLSESGGSLLVYFRLWIWTNWFKLLVNLSLSLIDVTNLTCWNSCNISLFSP